MSEIKKRNWAMVLYPESLPANWQDILTQTGLPAAISPLHDQDQNESIGELKKPHYHVIVCYEGPTTFKTVKKITDDLNAPIPIAIESVRGAYRYLTHKDNPEKHQYNEKDIKLINGFSILDYSDLTKGEILKFKKDLIDLIRSKNITEYYDLINFLYDNDMSDLLDVASSHTFFLDSYIRSARNKAKVKFEQEQKLMAKFYKDKAEKTALDNLEITKAWKNEFEHRMTREEWEKYLQDVIDKKDQ